MSSSIEEVSIFGLNEAEKRERKQTHNLWKLTQVDKSFQLKLEE